MATDAERQTIQVVSSIELRGQQLKIDFVNIQLPEGSKVEPGRMPMWIRFEGAELRIKPEGLG